MNYLENGARKDGTCSSLTPSKQDDFRKILDVQMKMCNAFRRGGADPYYHYIDLNSGWGTETSDIYSPDGSPLIFLKCAASLRWPVRALFCEERPRKANVLNRNIYRVVGDLTNFTCDHHVLFGDHRQTAIQVARTFDDSACAIPGLIYADPCGCPPSDVLADLTALRVLRKLDVLVYLNNTAIKRVLKSPEHEKTERLGISSGRLTSVISSSATTRGTPGITGNGRSCSPRTLTFSPNFGAWVYSDSTPRAARTSLPSSTQRRRRRRRWDTKSAERRSRGNCFNEKNDGGQTERRDFAPDDPPEPHRPR